MFEFLHVYGDSETIVNNLREVGLLRTQMLCTKCGDSMRLQVFGGSDGVRFECSKAGCRCSRSVRKGSFFENARVSLCSAMLLVHLWAKGYTEKLILDDYEFAIQTVVDWFRFCRDITVEHFGDEQGVIGGPGCIVEIDETIAVKRKYNRGRMLAAGWLFGGIERRNDGHFNCFMRLVYNRSGAHLKHLIQQHVAPGTHIVTDGWGGYVGLQALGYEHCVVIHEENFVSPGDPAVHTQRIEATWGSLKRFIRARGTNKGTFYAEYVCEWIFRRKFDDVFDAMLTGIRQKYNFSD